MAWTMTASQWRSSSKNGKIWRSSEFNAIEKAIGKYNVNEVPKTRLQKLKAILDAVAYWWVWKQENKFGVQNTSNDKLSPGQKPRNYAMPESKLVAQNAIVTEDDFSVRGQAVRGLIRAVAAEIDEVLAVDRAMWGSKYFTDPAKHVATDFRYLVSAQSETPKKGELPFRIKTIENPDLISDAVISASIITQDSISLWGPAGFILKAPKRNIAAAHHDDLAVANGTGLHHAMEKYIELLRIYLSERTEGLVTKTVGLPSSPGDVLPTKLSQHSEVMVLGRNYDKVTSVAGIFLLVDTVSKNPTPARCYRQISQFILKVSPFVKYVVEKVTTVTDARMALYENLQKTRKLPIVQIVVNANTALGVSYFDAVHDGTIMFPFNGSNMVLHDSQEHKNLERDAKQGKVTKMGKLNGHTCDTCGVIKVV